MRHRSFAHRFEKLSEAVGSAIEATGMFATMVVMATYIKIKQTIKP